MIRLVIEKIREGGFLVYDGDGLRNNPSSAEAIFAATDIADALGFIGDKLAPVEKMHTSEASNTMCFPEPR